MLPANRCRQSSVSNRGCALGAPRQHEAVSALQPLSHDGRPARRQRRTWAKFVNDPRGFVCSACCRRPCVPARRAGRASSATDGESLQQRRLLACWRMALGEAGEVGGDLRHMAEVCKASQCTRGPDAGQLARRQREGEQAAGNNGPSQPRQSWASRPPFGVSFLLSLYFPLVRFFSIFSFAPFNFFTLALAPFGRGEAACSAALRCLASDKVRRLVASRH